MYSPPWNPYCPQGGQFYACGNGTKFVGCCDYVNPCIEPTGCSAGNLRQTSFEPSKHGTFADQQCSAGLFYTCNGTTPDSFFGCCTINPCANNGCPRDDLAAAFLSNNPEAASDMDPYPPIQGMTASTSTASSSAASSTATPESSSSSVPVGAIAGGAVGGFLLIAGIIVIFWFMRRRKRRDQHSTDAKHHPQMAAELSGAYDSNSHGKAAMTKVTAMGSPYQDSPSTVPPYSNPNTPAPHYPSGGWSTHPAHHQRYPSDNQVHETEARSQFKPYSPHEQSMSGNSTHHSPQPQFSPSLSQTSDPMRSWGSQSSGVPPRKPVGSPYSNQGFARVHQGPPQELGGDSGVPYPNVGLGVQHIGDSTRHSPEPPRVELDGRSGGHN